MSNFKDRIRHLNLSGKLTRDIIVAFFIAIVIIFSLLEFLDWGVDAYFYDSNKWDKRIEAKAQELQQYITARNISIEEVSSLSEWCEDNENLYVDIYDDEINLFTSTSYGVSYSNMLETELDFSDGKLGLELCYFIDYKYYYFSEILCLGIGMITFLFIVLRRIRKIVREIDRIESDIKILETGGLEHEIKVNSNDELGSLQRSLDDMRIALAKNIKIGETLARANNDLVTRMSHDLRTPLTSLILYLDLIREKKYMDEAELQKYVNVSKAKAEQIKEMSEIMFDRFLVTGDNEKLSIQNAFFRYAFEDSLSGLVMTLDAQGFVTYTDIKWFGVRIQIIPKYVDRVLDNIYSNLIKYANKENPIVIGVDMEDDKCVIIRIVNHIGARNSAEGSGIGLENIRLMMEKMGGSFVIREDDRTFTAELSFRIIE